MASTPTQTGPRLTVVGSCGGCEHLRIAAATRYCAHLATLDKTIGYTYTPDEAPAWCPLLADARLALLTSLARTVCRKCGATVESVRECYAIPTCFACLPPPPRLPLHTIGTIDESAIRTMAVGDKLIEPTDTPGEHITAELGDGGWIVRLGTGDPSLAGTSKLAMRYVKDRRSASTKEPSL